MKLNVLLISLVLGSSCHAAPLLKNVADITSDRSDVPAGDVYADSQGVHLHQDQDQEGSSLLQKRSPLLNNQGVDSGSGDGVGLLSELLTKRQNENNGGAVGTLTMLSDLSNEVKSMLKGKQRKRDESNDDDGDDLFKHIPPPSATYGSGMAAANRPSQEVLMDAMTKRGEEEEEEQVEDTDDASSNGENKQDRPGPPPPNATPEQLDDFYSKH